jgi:hypothetical protein
MIATNGLGKDSVPQGVKGRDAVADRFRMMVQEWDAIPV